MAIDRELAQLDLSYNALASPLAVRPLSCNRALRELVLHNTPLAEHPRYRPSITCLLPHLRKIDHRQLPPSREAPRSVTRRGSKPFSPTKAFFRCGFAALALF